ETDGAASQAKPETGRRGRVRAAVRGAARPASPSPEHQLRIGLAVSHPTFGDGTVTAVRGQRVDVDFGGEERTIRADYLEPAAD
ncbi:MAG TPA: hypothetical protein VF832_10425, partial [Longimicrobiales bacterium]